MKASYTFIDHTADVLFKAQASTVEELFVQCGLALEETQVDISLLGESSIVEFDVESKDIERLLFDFLDELVCYKDADLLLFKKFEISIEEREGKEFLHCKAYGDVLDHAKHDPKVDVKAITMHMFEVKEIEGGFEAQVLVDI